MSLIKTIYFGVPKRVFAQFKTIRKPAILALATIFLIFAFSFGVAVYVVATGNVVPIKAMAVVMAFSQKLQYATNHRPVPDGLEKTIHDATPAEQSFAGWFVLFGLFVAALLFIAFIWAWVLTKRSGERTK